MSAINEQRLTPGKTIRSHLVRARGAALAAGDEQRTHERRPGSEHPPERKRVVLCKVYPELAEGRKAQRTLSGQVLELWGAAQEHLIAQEDAIRDENYICCSNSRSGAHERTRGPSQQESTLMPQDNILEKIRKIEALIKGGATEGERLAAIAAKQRVLEKYSGQTVDQGAVEYKLSTSDPWHKSLLMAICRKYELKPYRYHRQKYTTLMVKVNTEFLDKIIWPEYLRYSELLEDLVGDITEDLIDKIHRSEVEKLM
ncbi:MAG: hypothetical protein COC01_09460 [Bacteroidetes bacterium]|nr:MAG: hypothetical protein COC01_09460 [Bacteroidota bacterium]